MIENQEGEYELVYFSVFVLLVWTACTAYRCCHLFSTFEHLTFGDFSSAQSAHDQFSCVFPTIPGVGVFAFLLE